MNRYLSPKELAEEARRAFAANPMTPEEHWEFLIREGLIDRNGRVLCNRLFGERTVKQPDPTTAAPEDGSPEQAAPAQPCPQPIPVEGNGALSRAPLGTIVHTGERCP